MDKAPRVQIMNEGVCISHSSFGKKKRYEPNYSPSSYGQIVDQTELFKLGMTASLG